MEGYVLVKGERHEPIKDELHISSCAWSMLVAITVMLGVQTLLASLTVISVYTTYRAHEPTLLIIRETNWSSMLDDSSRILHNTNNITQKANRVLHSNGMAILDKTSDIVGNIGPITTRLADIVDDSLTVSVKDVILNIRHLSRTLDTLRVDELINVSIAFVNQTMRELSPEVVNTVMSTIDHVNGVMTIENADSVRELVKDADVSIRTIDKFLKIIGSINGKSTN